MDLELAAWTSFSEIVQSFLGNNNKKKKDERNDGFTNNYSITNDLQATILS